MTPSTIIRDANTDGVSLSLTAAGTIKATGDGAAVNRWLAAIRDHKPGIIKLLSEIDREAFEERATIMEFDGGLSHGEAEWLAAEPIHDAIEEPAAAVVESCRVCRHLKRPGLADGYCGERTDLPPAYGEHHPLRLSPTDGDATCDRWEGWR